MIPGERYGGEGGQDVIPRIRAIIGVALVIVGCMMAFWAFANVYKIFTNPEQIEAFKQIAPENPEFRELDIEGRKAVIPEGLFHFMAYVIACFLLLIAGVIGASLVTGGANLLQTSFRRLEAKVDKKMDKLKDKMEKIGDLIEKKIDTE